MWTNTFLFLWLIGTVKHKSTPIPIDCAKRVQKCPVEKEQWTQKNDQLNCTADFGYVCLRDADGYLFEACIANFTIQANSSNCPILFACKKNNPYLGVASTYYPCPKELSGCPPQNHAKYSIHHLYKYPKCIESHFTSQTGSTSTRSTTSISMTTISTDYINGQKNTHVVIIIVLTALLLVVFGCFIGGYAVYSRKKYHGMLLAAHEIIEDAEVTNGEKKDTSEEYIQELRCWVQLINESEADKIRILPLKEDDTIEVDRIYVPVSIVDEYQIHTSKTTDIQTISELTPDKMFKIAPGKPAHFIFMLGDAGYGKTVQCRRIAKSWCKAWKDEIGQEENYIQVINSENTKNEKLKEWEKYLKDFEFLFYVPMRDVNNEHVSVEDMIRDYYHRFVSSHDHLRHLDDILNVLKDKRYKCLIILDGLDEWSISESKRKNLPKKGIPNCEGMLNCTFLFAMRSWRFMEVDSIYRQGLFAKILLLHGLDNNSIEELTTNMLCNYFNMERHSKEFSEQCENVKKKVSSPSHELKSLMKIPLLAVFFILTWHESIETGQTLTTFYLSMIEALMKRSFKDEQISPKRGDNSKSLLPSILKNFFYVSKRMPEISRLGKIAFDDLHSQGTTFVLNDVQLKDPEVKETISLFLRIGILSKRDTAGQIHENNVRFSFLHKTIQEFTYSLYLVHDRSEADIAKSVIDEVSDIEKTLELSTVLTFVSGLSPAVGCKVSSHIADLTSKDKDIIRFRYDFLGETYYKVFQLFNLQLSCYREVRGGKTIKQFQESEMKFSFSDIFLHGYDTDRLTIREAADVLRYHADGIKSLCMKFIPDNGMEGITNYELKTFLRESESLVALNIDGFDRGNCRLFDDFHQRTQCLHTLGFTNVAFSDNILTEFLTKAESKRSIKALGLFYIKAADDLVVDFQYQFPSVYKLFSAKSGYIQKRKKCQVSTNSTPSLKEKRQPLLNNVLNELPKYYDLSTLDVSYMDSDEDRQTLLQVLPEIKTLKHFGYHGSSIYETPDDVYDSKVIKVLLRIYNLRTITLSQIILKENVLQIPVMSLLERIKLQQLEMKKSDWMEFAESLYSMRTLSKVLLFDTNIDEETCEMLKKLSLTIVKDDSTEW